MRIRDLPRKRAITHRLAVGKPLGFGGKNAPTELDHFEITTVDQNKADNQFPIDGAGMARLGEMGYNPTKPQRIPVRAPSDNIDDFLTQSYKCNVEVPAKGLDGQPLVKENGKPAKRAVCWCVGDGVNAKRKTKGGEVTIPCRSKPKREDGSGYDDHTPKEMHDLLNKPSSHDPTTDMKRCPFAQNKSPKDGPCCKPHTELIVHCDVVSKIGSYARYRSQGYDTAMELPASLESIKASIPGGVLAGIPLDLVITRKRMFSPGSTFTAVHSIVHAELRLTTEDTVRLLNARSTDNSRLLEAVQQERKLLAAAKIESADDTGVIDGEFGEIASASVDIVDAAGDAEKPSGNLGE